MILRFESLRSRKMNANNHIQARTQWKKEEKKLKSNDRAENESNRERGSHEREVESIPFDLNYDCSLKRFD